MLFFTCIFNFSLIITLCFTNVIPDSSLSNQKAYHYSASDPKIHAKLKSNIYMRTKAELDDEPGFDLSEKEMKRFKIWQKGIIPYYIDTVSFSDKVLRDRLRNFLNNINRMTSLNFVELPSPPQDENTRWVFFVNRRGQLKCSDPHIKDFTNEGVQQVVLGYDCFNDGGALSEAVLALVGVPAQHNAPNRDQYIKVNMANIVPEKRYLFTKLKNDEWLFHDVAYDYTSTGHYDLYRNSANGQATIELLNGYPDTLIAETSAPSPKDILKIKMLYNYITKKRFDVPECHKLFEPGVNFDNIAPEVFVQEPRKKPFEYLGIENNQNNKNNYANSSQEIENSEKIVISQESITQE